MKQLSQYGSNNLYFTGIGLDKSEIYKKILDYVKRKGKTMKNNVEEKIIAEGWILKQEYTNAGLKLYQSPWDGKYHIYDDYAEELLDKAFDRIENVFSNYNNIYLVVTLNGKQGLYHYSNYKKGKGFMTKIEYDYIESLSTLLVFTKEGKKRFAYVYDEEKLSEEFDDITMDENRTFSSQ